VSKLRSITELRAFYGILGEHCIISFCFFSQNGILHGFSPYIINLAGIQLYIARGVGGARRHVLHVKGIDQ
jgi:hypothetical protein